MRDGSYLFRSSALVYYFRIRVPLELLHIFKCTELRKSLRTKNKQVALRLSREYASAAKQVFETLRLENFKAELTRVKQITQAGPSVHDHDRGIQLWNAISKEHENIHEQRVKIGQQLGLNIEQALELAQPAIISPPASKQIPLSRLIQLYILDVTDQRGLVIAHGIEKNLLRFMQIVSDRPIDQYTVEDKLKYREILQLMPKCLNRRIYRRMSVNQIIKQKHAPDQLLSIKTVNMRLIEVATLFNWAVNHALIDNHPFKKVALKIHQNEDLERPAVSDSDIKVILENLLQNTDEPSKYWIPLIACYTGMRQSEIAQLDGDDIVLVEDAWCIDVNDRGDKKLKNINARRVVPLHPVLLEAGLVDFASNRHGMKLFKDIRPYNGKYGHQVSKFFTKYLESLGIAGSGQTFHGLRHSVITKLWAAGIPEAHTAALVGHQRGKQESYNRYAKKTDIKPLLQAIEVINYGEINLTAWFAK